MKRIFLLAVFVAMLYGCTSPDTPVTALVPDNNKAVVILEHPIKPGDHIKGWYDSDGMLHINVDNNISFIWNDDEESIPQPNTLITLQGYSDEDGQALLIGPYDPKAIIEDDNGEAVFRQLMAK